MACLLSFGPILKRPRPLNMIPIKVYGIKNCDTMKKTFNWLEANGVAYDFHDYKKLGVPEEKVLGWCAAIGWHALLNTKGPTWRKLTPAQQAIRTPAEALAVMRENSSVIRRPLIERADGKIQLGFDATQLDGFVR